MLVSVTRRTDAPTAVAAVVVELGGQRSRGWIETMEGRPKKMLIERAKRTKRSQTFEVFFAHLHIARRSSSVEKKQSDKKNNRKKITKDQILALIRR